MNYCRQIALLLANSGAAQVLQYWPIELICLYKQQKKLKISLQMYLDITTL